MNILVADKDVSVLSRIVGLIRGWGYEAEGSETGQETLEKLKKNRFDLVLIDMAFPDMSVQALIGDIKDLRPDIGIVTMTETSTDALENEVRTLGIVYYMLKPVSEAVLKDILDHSAKKKAGQVKKNHWSRNLLDSSKKAR